jgi:hypothetical protein
MRRGNLTEDCVHMTGKASLRAIGRRSDANNETVASNPVREQEPFMWD